MIPQHHLFGGPWLTIPLWTLWGASHVLFCAKMFLLLPFEDKLVDKLYLYAIIFCNLAILTQILLSRGIAEPVTDSATAALSSSAAHRERRLNLVGGFILSVIPLGLSALAFASSHPSVRFGLGAKQHALKLQELQPSKDFKPHIFIGIDVSRSVLDEKNALQNICDIIDSLLTAPEPALRPISERATVLVYQIGSTANLTDRFEGSDEPAKDSGQQKSPETLSEKICGDLRTVASKKSQDTNFTDIATFLKSLPIQNDSRNFIIIASDFLNESPHGKPSLAEEEVRISNILQDLSQEWPRPAEDDQKSNHAGTSLYFLRLDNKTYLDKLNDTNKSALAKRRIDANKALVPVIDILPLLKWKFPDQWIEHPVSRELLQDAKVSLRMKGALTPLFRIPVKDPVYLVYDESLDNSNRTPPPAIIQGLKKRNSLSEQREVIGLQLRAYPDQGSLPDEIQIRYRLGQEGQPGQGLARLALGQREPEWIREAVAAEDSSLAISLASNYGQSRATHSLELVILAPSQGVKYAIPLTILPLYPPWCQFTFKLIVVFFAMSVVLLIAIEFWLMPPSQLLANFNSARINYLERVSGAVHNHYQRKKQRLAQSS